MKKKALCLVMIMVLMCLMLSSCKKKTEINVVLYEDNTILQERLGIDKLKKDAKVVNSYYLLQSEIIFDENTIGYISFDRMSQTKGIFGISEDDHRGFYIAESKDVPISSMINDLYLFFNCTKGLEAAKNIGYNAVVERPYGFCAACLKPVDEELLTIYTDEESYDVISEVVSCYHGYNKEGQFEVVKVKDPTKKKLDDHTMIAVYADSLEIENAKISRFADNNYLNFIISPNRDLSSISIDKLRGIFTGKIKYWEDI